MITNMIKKIAVIGECMIELSSNSSQDGSYQQSFAGDTFNCAVYLKRELPKSVVEYVTVIGDDKLSEKLLQFFHQHEINSNYVDKMANKKLGLYLIELDKGERSFNYWRETSAAKHLFLTDSTVKFNDEVHNYDLIYFSAISLAVISKEGRDNFFKILKNAKQKGVKIAFDSNYRPNLYDSKQSAKELYNQAMPYCDIFLPSAEDEQALWGDKDPTDTINRTKQYNINETIIKSGEEDILYYHNNTIDKVKTKKLQKIVDSTSAGDSFNGSYLANRLSGINIPDSIERASRTASKVIMHHGSIIPLD
jgi:2-dehydro-3-deoxygluconokinase